MKDAETALRLDPKFVRGYSRKGLALYKLGKVEKACDAYREGLKLEPLQESKPPPGAPDKKLEEAVGNLSVKD